MSLEALVKVNGDPSPVFKDKIELKYNRIGKYIYGTNGLLYQCYYFDEPGGAFYAFGGRKFELKLESGEVVECYGQWWDGGYSEVSKMLGVPIVSSAGSTVSDLKRCYVFTGYHIDKSKFDKIVSEYNGTIFNYWEYEKYIKYDDLRDEYFNYKWKSEKAKKTLIKNVKLFSSKLKEIKSFISYI